MSDLNMWRHHPHAELYEDPAQRHRANPGNLVLFKDNGTGGWTDGTLANG